jgi:6-phosphogluconolactonase (cycloisomerase 2 family)
MYPYSIRALCSGFLIIAALAGCHSSGISGTDNAVTATASASGTVAVVVGGSRTISLTFNADDGHAVSNLSVTDGLANLPANWSGPAVFDCASVAAGSGCVLNLKYTPAAAGAGTVTISYGYINNAGVAEKGSIAIPYAATSSNNVLGNVSPAGQINAIVGGGTQSVAVNFTTDDGAPAGELSLTTDLTALPAGWSAATGDFSCATVGAGNGCRLALTYAPTAAASGTLSLNYSYKDNSGTPKTGTVDFSYASTVHNNVAAAVSPSGEVAVVTGGTQTVGITLTTDDGNPASALTFTTALSSLPAYWSSTSSGFSCATVSTGNGCHLTLTFAPSAVAAGTVTLNYAYKDNSGAAKTGTVTIPYASTSHNNASVAVSPAGQVAVVTGGSQPVNLTFTSDDGNPITALSVTSGLTSLPAGWSAASPSFSCGSASTGSACRLALTFAPQSVGSGSVMLNYAYHDNSGTAKTGSVSVPYTATVHDNVGAAVSPSGTVSVSVVGSQAVTLTFTTDDGNIASALSVTTDLTSLPAGWTSASNSFSCSAVSTGSACRLSLTFAPTSVGSGTLGVNFSYDDNAGMAKTGSASIDYAAIPQRYLYAANYVANTVSVCPIKGDGSLDTCQLAGTGFSAPTGIKVAGNLLYVANFSASVDVCTIASDATLSSCQSTGSGFQNPIGIAINGAGTLAYVSNYGASHPSVCTIDVNGLLNNCISTGLGTAMSWDIALSGDGSYAYVSDPAGADIDACTVALDGTFSACTGNAASLEPFGIAVRGAYLYQTNLGPGSVGVCPLNSDGSIGTCATAADSSAGIASPIFLTFAGSLAYVSNYYSNSISICPVNNDGTFGTCTVATDPSFDLVWGVAVH